LFFVAERDGSWLLAHLRFNILYSTQVRQICNEYYYFGA
jgi:hypothetical protein